MLKIKDNVDLKELEKFGFRYFEAFGKHYDIQSKEFCSLILVYVDNREISYRTTYYKPEEINEATSILYDLIKAGVVEKVEEVSNEKI